MRSIEPVARRGPRGRQLIDFAHVLTLALVATAVVDGVAVKAVYDPAFVGLCVLCAVLLNPLLQLLGASLLVKSGFTTALTVGMLAGSRNVALLIAVAGAGAQGDLLVFLAIAQLPAMVIAMLAGRKSAILAGSA